MPHTTTAIPATGAPTAPHNPTTAPTLVRLAQARCTGCGTWHAAGTSCPSCLTCDRCDGPVHEDDAIETVRGSTICPSCQVYYCQCDGCDGWNRDGADCGNGCDEDDYDEDTDDRIHDDSYKPYPEFHGDGPLYLGPEIEIETRDRDECAEIVLDQLGELGYLKTDGSLEHGFEIVTHPMSYPWAMCHFPWPMLDDLHRAGGFTTANTGLHIHLSRAGFCSPAHVYRWMKFIYRNQPQVVDLAGRSSSEWARFDADDRRAVVDYAKGDRGYSRYRAINTTNTTTFELRVFASSLQARQVQAVFGFAAASVDYTRTLTIPALAHGAWSWEAFRGWLDGQPAYQPLTARLQEEGSCVC